MLTTYELPTVLKFDAGLAIGDLVEVRWTHSFGHYTAIGRVTKLNACSLKVALAHDVATNYDGSGGWPQGFEITSPRCVFRALERWSWSNGVFPVLAPCDLNGCSQCAQCQAFDSTPPWVFEEAAASKPATMSNEEAA